MSPPSREGWYHAHKNPRTIRLFLPNTLLFDRKAFLHICTKERLHLLSHAKFNAHCDHLSLTVTRQDHLQALHPADASAGAALTPPSANATRRRQWPMQSTGSGPRHPRCTRRRCNKARVGGNRTGTRPLHVDAAAAIRHLASGHWHWIRRNRCL